MKKKNNKKKYTIKEIAEHFCKTRITILNWRKRGCPYHTEKKNEYGSRNSVYFYIDEVIKWTKENITR